MTSGAPKRYLSASVAQFIDVYLAIGATQRHAYELLEHGRACHLYFDLVGHCDGSGACETVADCVAEEAAGVLLDLVAARAPALPDRRPQSTCAGARLGARRQQVLSPPAAAGGWT